MTTQGTKQPPGPGTSSWLDELRDGPVIRPSRFAAISHMPRSTVYDAIANGSLPSLKIGRTLYLPTQPLLELFGAGDGEHGSV